MAAINRLRRSLGQEEGHYHVMKNTLTRLACRRVGLEALEEFLAGPTAIAYTSGDPVSVAKTLLKFGGENDALSVKGGMLEGRPLNPAQIKALGDIPPKEILLAMVCGGFQAPISGLATVLQGSLRKLVYALDEVRRLKETA